MTGPFIVLITFAVVLVQPISSTIVQKETKTNNGLTPLSTLPRNKRSTNYHIVKDCMTVTSDSGRFFVKAAPDANAGQVCGLYFTADADKKIKIQFQYFDVPCQGGGLVAFVDGWELNGELFPSATDHEKPFEERFDEFCGEPKLKKIFVSSQNAALLQYRLPLRRSNTPVGFSVIVQHISNPQPCNVLSEGTANFYTVRNYGRKVNCSISMLAPGKVRIVNMQVGMAQGPLVRERETGILNKCKKRGIGDFLEIGGGKSLDTDGIIVGHEICGLVSKPDDDILLIGCPISTVRLISSGIVDNLVTIQLEMANGEDFTEASITEPILCL